MVPSFEGPALPHRWCHQELSGHRATGDGTKKMCPCCPRLLSGVSSAAAGTAPFCGGPAALPPGRHSVSAARTLPGSPMAFSSLWS